jgi:hypothetical protein
MRVFGYRKSLQNMTGRGVHALDFLKFQYLLRKLGHF